MIEPRLILGDCVEQMRELEPESVDAVVSDPPYGLEFMGKTWDRLTPDEHRRSERNYAGVFSGNDTPYARGETVVYNASPNPTCRNCGGLRSLNAEGSGGRHRCQCDRPDFPNYMLPQAQAMQEWHFAWALEALRVLKPGGFLLAFGGTRTYHRLACAVEDAGFEIRDRFWTPGGEVEADEVLGELAWFYGSGFPKSLDVAKSIRKAGEDAEEWEGWGTALKPAHEPIVVARKPLTGTVAANVLQHGTGALNVDACRIGFAGDEDEREAKEKNRHADFGSGPRGNEVYGKDDRDRTTYEAPGRWPANVILLHLDACIPVGTREVKGDGNWKGSTKSIGYEGGWDTSDHPRDQRVPDLEQVEAWDCAPGCPVAELDTQSGESRSSGGINGGKLGARVFGAFANEIIGSNAGGLGDSGGASRFFYTAKASRAERNAGLEDFEAPRADATTFNPTRPVCNVCECGTLVPGPGKRLSCAHNDYRFEPSEGGKGGEKDPARNHHPTVKPIALMRWLVRLVTPPGGLVLDPFLGSGTTGIAADLEGFRFVGIERDPDYMRLAEARISFWREHGEDALRIVAEREFAERRRRDVQDSGQLDLLGGVT